MRDIKFEYWNGNKMLKQEAFVNHLNKYIARNDKNLRQYIGLKDEYGVEIYECDIIQHFAFDSGDVFVVEWDDINGCWHGYGTFNEWKDCEVVGNIYENKELLNA